MTPKRVLCLALSGACLSLASPGPVLAAAPAPPPQAERPESFTFAFRDADIAQVAEEILGNALGVPYTVDPGVTGKVSFRIDRRLTRAQLLEAFEAALAVNDVALLRQGDSLVLAPRDKARSSAALRDPGAISGGRRGGYDVVAVPLSFSTPTEVAKALEAMTGSKAVLYSNDKLGLIVLGGSGSELQSLLETIKILDRNVFEGARIRWFDLHQAAASTVSADLAKILSTAGVQGVSVSPLSRLNGLIVSARTETAMNEVAGWIVRLDTPSRDLSTQLYVYRPRSASAGSLAATLSQVLSTGQGGGGYNDRQSGRETSRTDAVPVTKDDGATSSGGEGGSEGQSEQKLEDGVRIGVDRDSNTLIIRAPAARWMSLQQTLAEIDRPPSQVMIEASIIEVSLTNDFRFGVDWSAVSGNGKLGGNSVYTDNGVIGPKFPGFSITYLGGDIDAAINALGSRTAIDVVSAPKLITLDNHKARLQIGDQVPIVTQTATDTTTSSPAIVNTVEYRDTGVILEVTPRISGDDKVVVDIAQEVSGVAKTVTSGIDSPTIQQRKLSSTLVLQDGAVVALGGLISHRRSDSDSGVPGLKDVKLLGNLFKSKSKEGARTELVVLLTVRIMRDPAASGLMTRDLLADMREIESRGLLPH
ncbi:type II secretion system secretin GspD [Caulobacter sp. Root1472]|uniref:type II secretion system secretin GspD n=1 Tax=Caulobacter sp. Root1472 TaxID=1736470 RepID=UPI000AB07506|nr:type II secretion system secretin GspD [Caulobacter sp. Root1472]